jgi:hypothetical protein
MSPRELGFSLRCVAVLLIGTAVSCSDSTTVEENGVRAAVTSQGVQVINTTDQRLALFAADTDVLPLLDWIKCNNTSTECLRIPAHGSLTIPIAGDDGSGDVAVYVWTVYLAASGEYVTRDVANLRVTR